MKSPFEPLVKLEHDSGRTPLFPLTSTVLFPHALLPLRVSGAAHCRMISDALAADGVIAVALVHPEAEFDEQHPAVFQTVCLGRITAARQLSDDHCELLLQGVSRARLLDEDPAGAPYRKGRMELVPDRYPAQPVIERDRRCDELLGNFAALFDAPPWHDLLGVVSGENVPLGVLSDILAYALDLDPPTAQRLLEEFNADFRSDVLLDELRSALRSRRRNDGRESFPPRFSRN